MTITNEKAYRLLSSLTKLTNFSRMFERPVKFYSFGVTSTFNLTMSDEISKPYETLLEP